MSRKERTKHNVTLGLFIILTASISFPFHTLPIYGDIGIESDFQLINALLGKGFVGEPLSNSIYSTIEYYIVESLDSVGAIPKAQAQLPEAEAQEPSYPIITRGDKYETIQLDKHNYTTQLGLPEYIERFDGVFIPYEFWEDANMVTYNSADMSFVFDKNACAYTVYNDGRIFTNATEIIKSDTWVVKFAENGTDNWVDVPQQSLGCTVEVMEQDDDVFQIHYTKSDSLGTIDHMMNKTITEGMKHIVSYTNNNPAWNNTKIGFSHIMSGSPENLSILTVDSANNTQYESHYLNTNSSAITNDFGVNATTNISSYDISHDDLLFNATSMIADGFSFHFTDDVKQPLHYDFDQGLDKLWNMRYLEEDGITSVYLDYMNDPAIVGVGETVTIDPILTNSGGSAVVNRINIIGSQNTVGINGHDGCANNGLGCAVGGIDSTWQVRSVINQVWIPFITYDISPIPSNADVQQVKLGHQAGIFYATIGRTSRTLDVFSLNGEDFTTLSAQALTDCIYHTTGGGVPHSQSTPFSSGGAALNTPSIPRQEDGRIGDGNPTSNPCGMKHLDMNESPATPIEGNAHTFFQGDLTTHDDSGDLSNDLEDRFLSQGLTKYTYIMCDYSFGRQDNTNNGINSFSARTVGLQGCAGNIAAAGTLLSQGSLASSPLYATQTGHSNKDFSYTVSSASAGTFMEITYVVLTQPSAPLGLVCNPTTPTSVDLDWFPPVDLGGAAFVSGYKIERDSGGGFTDLIADTGSSISFATDNSVSAGTTFKYRVSALTQFGQGEVSSEVSCGVAGVSNEVTDLTAQNQALNVVALDWSEPSFTGNTPITGYQIDRTEGTPTAYPDTIQFINHDDLGGGTLNQVVALTPTTGGASVTGSGGRGGNSPTWQSTAYFFQVFAVDDIDGKEISFDWSGVNRKWITPSTSIGCSGGGSARILDGAYTLQDANQPNIGQDFPQSTTLPLKGHGVLQTLATHAIIPNPPHCGGISSSDEGWSFIGFTDTIDITDPSPSLGATGEFVTLIFSQQMENSQDPAPTMLLENLQIEPIKHWDLNSNVFSTYSPFTAGELGTNCGASGSQNPATCGEYNAGSTFVVDPLGFETIVVDTGNTNVEYLDSTVEQNKQYGYRVFSINGEGISPSSNIVSITTAGQPEQVAVPTVTATGTQTIDISWAEPNLNGGGLLDYDIQRKIGVGGIFVSLVGGLTTTEYTDGSGLFTLSPATEYCYRVSVETVIGLSDPEYSDEACATTFDAPSEVTNLIVTALDGSSVDMSFNDPTSDGGSAITGYKIEQQIGAGAFTTLDALTFTQFRNDTGLPVGTLITYRVTASNQFGFGDPVTGSDTTDATPQVPQDFVCSAGTPDSINLSWSTPVTFSPPTGYQIQRNIDGGAFVVHVADTASTGTTHNDDSLATDTIYGYKILAHTAEGDTLLTPEVFCQTLKQPDAPPENFKADFSQTIPHDVILSWDIPNLFGVPISSITVERDDGAGFNELAVLPPNAVGMVDSTPNNDVKQKYRIKMTGSLGDSKYGFAIPSDLNRISHFNFEKTISDSGDEKNSATVSGMIDFVETGHAGTRAFDYDGASYVIVDVAQESDYDFDRLTPFGGSLYYEGGNAGGASFTDEWFAINHKYSGSTMQQFSFSTNTGGLSVGAFGTATNTRGDNHIFKVFNATDLDGKTVDYDFNGYFREGFATQCTGSAYLRIYDGAYSIADGGGADFPDGTGKVSKGAGLLQTLASDVCNPFGGSSIRYWSLDGISPVIDLSSATDPSGLVTLMFDLSDTNAHSNVNGQVPNFSITDVALNKLGGADERIWDFRSNDGGTYTEDVPQACIWNCGTVDTVEVSLLGLQALITKAQTLASVGWSFYLDGGFPVFRMNGATQSIEVKSDEFVSTNTLEHLAFSSNGNSTGAGIQISVNGIPTGLTIVTDTLSSESILNNEPLVFGATSTGTNILQSTTDEIMIFGENLEDEEITEIANDEVQTVAPINATMTLTGSTFANISSEEPEITLISGFPLPSISGNLELKNFTTTTVNTASGLSIPASGVLTVPAMFNQMGSLSNYTAITTLDNGLDVFVVISNEDLQNPLFSLPAGIEFFFQQQRINNFEDLSFNFTKTSIPFDLACNLKSELFEDGVTYPFENVGFIQAIFDVPRTKDVVVACIDQNSPLLNPDEPSFGGSNALLTFVSFGDTTGIGAFLNFTDNYGDFFGAPLPYLFIILAAALFTGRSAPTGIIVIGVALGIMWYLGLLVIDPVLWGIIVVLIILGAIGGKKFL